MDTKQDIFDNTQSQLMDSSWNTNETGGTMNEIASEIIEDIILELCFEVHRAVKLGFFFLYEDTNDCRKPLNSTDTICPFCERTVEASGYSRHYSKCSGTGRQRRATKSDPNYFVDDDSEENDSDSSSTKRKAKRKQGKSNNARRGTKIHRKDIAGSSLTEQSSDFAVPFENKSLEERKEYFNRVCGVFSARTKKMCTKSPKCPQHSTEQKMAVRSKLLGQTYMAEQLSDVQIDVDTVDEETRSPSSSSAFSLGKRS